MDFTKQQIKIVVAINSKHLLEAKIKKYIKRLEWFNNYIENSKHIKPLAEINKQFQRKYKNILLEDSSPDESSDEYEEDDAPHVDQPMETSDGANA